MLRLKHTLFALALGGFATVFVGGAHAQERHLSAAELTACKSTPEAKLQQRVQAHFIGHMLG